jgi:amino acid adenylation domain-containing protein
MRVWALQQEGAQACSALLALDLQGPLASGELRRALQALVDRHDILRTSFVCPPEMDLPLQIVAASARVDTPLLDLRSLCPQAQCAVIAHCQEALKGQARHRERASLLLSMLLHLREEQALLLLALPALCADSATLVSLGQELAAVYAGQALEEPLQYSDVSAWQNHLLSGENAEAGERFWRTSAVDAGGSSRLLRSAPFFAGVSPLPTGEPALQTIVLSAALSARLQARVQQDGLTTAAWLLACWYTLLWRQQADLPAPGLTCDGRQYTELGQVPGLLARTVPLHLRCAPALPFEQFALLVQRACEQAQQWQTYFSGEVAGAVHFEYTRLPTLAAGNHLSIVPRTLLSQSEPFLLKLHALHLDHCVQLLLYYQRPACSAREAEQLGELLHTLLEATLDRPQTALGALPLLNAARERQLLQAARGVERMLPARCLHQLFEEQVRLFPTRPALVCRTEVLSYRQLNARANQLARLLRRRGVGPNVPVGLCMERGVAMIIALLAILKAAGAYLPLDAHHPSARLCAQLKESQVRYLLTERHLLALFAAWQGSALDLESVASEAAGEADDDLPAPGMSLDLAYIMYTSGSTGAPRGVMISQQSIVNYTLDLCRQLAAQPGWHYATVSTLAADLGNTVVFGALACGGCLHILPYETLTSARELAACMAQQPIDVLKIVPSHLWALLAAEEQAAALLPRRALLLGGEALSWQLLARLEQLKGSCAVYNHYGPTEATIGALLNPLGVLTPGCTRPPDGRQASAAVALGRPLANVEAYILDQRLQVLPPGVVGELYLGGAGLAAGYLQQPAHTAERFVPHPWAATRGARLYRSGDLAWSTPQGVITFVGRGDDQIKVRGQRIELGEIAAVLARHPGVREAVVLEQGSAANPQLVGYLVPHKQADLSSQGLQAFLRTWLPEYMLPTSLHILKQLPLTANGKVDRQALLIQAATRQEAPLPQAPRTPIEEILLEIWQTLLQVPTLGVHENFFEAGGHSLLATQVIGRVRALLHIELSILALFEAPSVAQLAQVVEDALRGSAGASRPPLLPVSRAQKLPLSFGQQRLWFLQHLEPESTAYLVPMVRRLRGPLASRALARSLRAVIQRHESLRTTFGLHEGEAVQLIEARPPLPLWTIDLCALAADSGARAARSLARQETERPCDLARGPLLRVSHLRLAPQEHRLLLTLHHSISDAWSNEILFRELSLFYQAQLEARPLTLPPLAVQYADYALWQRQWLQGETLAAQLAYWQEQLAEVPVLELPTDYPRPPHQRTQGAVCALTLPATLAEQLAALGQREGVTLFMLLLAAWQTLLARYTGQYDLSIGTPVTHRSHLELERLIGFFVNTLVLRSNLAGNPTFLQVLQRVRQVALSAYVHQDIPFEYLVEVLAPERDLSRTPFFQVMFSVVQAASLELAASQLGQLQVWREVDTETVATKFDLEINVLSDQQGLRCAIAYRSDLFCARTIEGLLAHFQVLLTGIVAHPEQRLASLPLLSAAQRQMLLVDWNQTHQDYPLDCTFAHLFARQVALTPERVALSHADTCLSYGALDRSARRCAAFLKQQGVGLERCVAVLLERSPELISAVLAILYADGVYLPLEPSFPLPRLQHMLAEAQVQVLITAAPWTQHLAGTVATLCEIAATWGEQEVVAPLQSAGPGEQLAYVIYTSGSSGQPKGAMLSSRGMLNHLYAKISALEIAQHDIVAQTASQCFDISLWQMLAALLVGGQVRIVSTALAHDPGALCREVETGAITLLEVVPALLRALVEERQAPGEARRRLGSLRQVVATGEALPMELAGRWQQSYPQIALLNAYGPTECSDDVTHAWLSASEPDAARRLSAPIGRAVANTQLYVLDEMGQPVPPGCAGQIYVGGAGVGRGYLADAWRTAQAFVPDPFGGQAGARLYCTGDLARYTADGQLEFLRRKDEQVKVRGYRIEPGEIAAVLAAHPRVHQSVVLVQEAFAQRQIVAYVVGRQGEQESAALRPADLRAFLSSRLPAYMLPARIVLLEALPLTANGKVDRRQLVATTWPQEALTEPERQPGQIEELVTQCWRQVLPDAAHSVHTNFFEAGGHSLLATRLLARLRQVLDREIPLRTIFEAPTIAALAGWIAQALRQDLQVEVPPLLPRARGQEDNLPLSFAQQRLWFFDQLEPGTVAYTIPLALHLRGSLHKQALARSFYAVIARHESLRTIFGVSGDQPRQIILAQLDFSYPTIDLQALAAGQRESVARELLQQVVQRPFALATGPLLRVLLLQIQQEEHVLLLTMHHIIADGWSTTVLISELSRLYLALSTGQASPLPPLPIQYADYALWQRAWLHGAALERRLAYWSRQLGGHQALQLPTDFARPPRPRYRGAAYHFRLDLALLEALQALSRQEGVTLFMTLLTAFEVLLYRFSGQRDLLVGTDIANRTRVETEPLIGFFINLLVLRGDLGDRPAFCELLRRTRETLLSAYACQDTPFEMLVERVLPGHVQDRMPLVQVLCVLQNQPQAPVQVSDLLISPFAGAETMTAKFDIALFMQESSQSLLGTVKYDSDLFKLETIATLMERFQTLLQSIVAAPTTLIDLLEIATGSEKLRQAERQQRSLRKLQTIRGEEIHLTEP